MENSFSSSSVNNNDEPLPRYPWKSSSPLGCKQMKGLMQLQELHRKHFRELHRESTNRTLRPYCDSELPQFLWPVSDIFLASIVIKAA
mmetsp:Transcript_59870/g.126749  ORF Transcript_59870/g.126749 Transcript_59870/m.126749 type:complete len:88 (+) Transcript_59870:240-503(+)